MNKSFLGKYFKREERKAKKLHHEVDPSSWPEYLTATQSRVRRVMVEQRAMPRVNKVASSIENLYMDETAQDVAHAQVAKSKRGGLERKLTPGTVLAWGGWGVAMVTFASSLLLNFPFGAGAFILKALPGEPRQGEIVLSTPQANVHPESSEEVTVSLRGVAKKDIKQVSVTLTYDPNALELKEVATQQSSFTKVLDSHYDAAAGKIFLSLEDEISPDDSLTLAKLNFVTKDFVGNTSVHVVPDTSIIDNGKDANIPKELGALGLHVMPASLVPTTVAMPNKKDSVTLDGNLEDWRDVITYNPASFKPAGIMISGKNIQEGRIISEKDLSGVLQLAQNSKNYYLAFSATDDEVLQGDTVAIKLGSSVYKIPIYDAINNIYSNNGVEAKVSRQASGYVLEVRIPKDSNKVDAPISFNFEVHDIDSQDSGVAVLSSPDDSEARP